MSVRYASQGFTIDLPEGTRDASLHAIELPGRDGSLLVRVTRLPPQTPLDAAVDTWLAELGRRTLGYRLLHRGPALAAGQESIEMVFDHRAEGLSQRTHGLALGLDACLLLVLVSGPVAAAEPVARLFERVRATLARRDEGAIS